MFEQFAQKLTYDAFRYGVGKAVFCQACDRVLDCTRAVEIEVRYSADDSVLIAYVCQHCAQNTLLSMIDMIQAKFWNKPWPQIHLYDGRQYTLKGKLRKRIAKPVRAAIELLQYIAEQYNTRIPAHHDAIKAQTELKL